MVTRIEGWWEQRGRSISGTNYVIYTLTCRDIGIANYEVVPCLHYIIIPFAGSTSGNEVTVDDETCTCGTYHTHFGSLRSLADLQTFRMTKTFGACRYILLLLSGPFSVIGGMMKGAIGCSHLAFQVPIINAG